MRKEHLTINIDEIKPYERNARKNDDAVASVVKSIEQCEYIAPIIVDEDNIILAGHTRYKALKQLNYKEIDVIKVYGLTDEQKRKYRLLDNKTNELAQWDFELLEQELDGLDFDDLDLDWGIDFLEEEKEIIEDEVPEVDDENEPITKLGDIWKLGNHRLMCGDSTNKETVERLMNGKKADLYLTDPPYNVNYTDGAEKERKILNDNFNTDEECGEKLWLPVFTNARDFSNESCSVYCFMPQGGTHMMMMMMKKAGWQVKHELIWLKQSIVLNRADYNYQHEPFMYGWNKNHKFYGKGKFKNTSVWQIDRPTKSKEHPTMKPVELFGEILKNATQENDIVLDTFSGSGTSFIACEQLNRICYGLELDPKYCDVIKKRWETLTGNKAEKIND